MKMYILLKARLRTNLPTKTYLRDLKDRDRLWILPIAGLGILTAAGYLILMLYQNYKAILTIGLQTGQPELTLFFAAIISGLLIFFLGAPLCLSNIFYSKDNLLAASLPVTTADIVLARMLSVYLFLLPVHLLIIIPAVAVYLPAAGNIAAIPAAAILIVAGPAFPLVVALAAASALAAAGGLSGRRTVFEIAGMLLAIGLAAAFQLAASRSLMENGDMAGLATRLTEYTVFLKKVFFASAWSARGFASGGYFYSLLALLFSTASVAAAAIILKNIRLNLVERQDKKQMSRSRSGGKSVPRASGSTIKTLLKREWMVMRSNSAFLIEAIGEVAILPILLAIFSFSIPGDMREMVTDITETIKFLPLAILGLLILMSALNSISCTSLSREGETFSISKSIPVSGSTQVRAKMMFHLLLFIPSWFINLIIIYFFLNIPAIHLVYLIPAGPAIILLLFAAAIHIDLARPVLKWTHPQQAMKQNMNVLTGMGFGMLVFIVVMLPAAGAYLLGLPIVIAGLCPLVIAAAADFIIIPRILRYSDRRYVEISV